MKALFSFGSAVALLFIIGGPSARSQDKVAAPIKPAHLQRMTPQGNIVQFVAASIVARRDPTDLAPTGSGVPLGMNRLSRPSVIHLEGNVEITIFKGASVHSSKMLTKEMILSADEADYDPETGEIQPQGHVSIKFQNDRPLPSIKAQVQSIPK
jgi:hypothetical protein